MKADIFLTSGLIFFTELHVSPTLQYLNTRTNISVRLKPKSNDFKNSWWGIPNVSIFINWKNIVLSCFIINKNLFRCIWCTIFGIQSTWQQSLSNHHEFWESVYLIFEELFSDILCTVCFKHKYRTLETHKTALSTSQTSYKKFKIYKWLKKNKRNNV